MHKIRIYIDTSVFGGVGDEEFAEPSRRFFERLNLGEFAPVVSTEVLRELRDAPRTVQDEFDHISEESLQIIPVSQEVESLADAYVNAGVLGRTSRSDALHVAAASVAEVDLIVSWNFRHIVNYDRIHKYNAVNVLNGYSSIDIRSPSEIAYGNET